MPTYRVDLEYPGVVCHGEIYELGDEVSRRRFAHEKPYLLERVGHPRKQDQERDDDSPQGIYKPGHTVSDDG